MEEKSVQHNNKALSNINMRSFLTVAAILLAILLLCGSLSYFVPQGAFQRDATGNIVPGTYVGDRVQGIDFWRVITAPVRVFASEDAVTIIMISIFLLVMSGIFNLLDKTGGIKTFIVHIMQRLQHREGLVICVAVLVFMLFGSLFGMFEELAALLPLLIAFMLSMKLDTMMGLGSCLMAACFGFSTAIANPFSVGTAAQMAGVPVSSGMWLRVVFFAIVYAVLCAFLMRYLKKIRRNPQNSPTYEDDLTKRANFSESAEDVCYDKGLIFRTYSSFFAVQGVMLIAIAGIRQISGFAIPLLAASFLVFGIIAGQIVCKSMKVTMGYFLRGAASMLPAVVMIALASSVKLVMTESNIIDTVMNSTLQMLQGHGKFVTILLIYALILFLQIFIGSASAKIFLVMPIVLPITNALGISPTLVILTYCMADGFTDVILPTNPVLLIGLSMANVSYVKWFKWTWKIQLMLFVLSVLVLLLGALVGY